MTAPFIASLKHASMQVTLGNLRNLEVPVLRVEDMPKLVT